MLFILYSFFLLYRYEAHYATPIGRKKGSQKQAESDEQDPVSKKRSNHCQRKIDTRKAQGKVSSALEEQFTTGRLYGKK